MAVKGLILVGMILGGAVGTRLGTVFGGEITPYVFSGVGSLAGIVAGWYVSRRLA